MTGSRGPRRPRSVPAGVTSNLEGRIVELEQRLMELEERRKGMASGGAWFAQIVPPEASRHFKNAGREQLLGLRVLADHWIGRLEEGTRPERRETIPIE